MNLPQTPISKHIDFPSPKNFAISQNGFPRAVSQNQNNVIFSLATPKSHKGLTFPVKNLPMFSEILGDPKFKSSPTMTLTEDQIKKKLLANLGPDKNESLETFKKYLQVLIDRKLAASEQKEKEDPLDQVTSIKKILQSKFLKKHNDDVNPKDAVGENELEDEILAMSQTNHEKILKTSKKLRDRMKTEKVDKAARFYKNKIKHFSNLDTFINAKEFFEDLNPFKEFNPDRQTSMQYQTKKHLMTIKKLQKESNDFYDKKMKEFNDRMTELDNKNVELKDKSESRHSDSQRSSKSSSVLSQLMREDRKNPTKIQINPYKVMNTLPILNQNDFTNNIDFLEKQLGMNKSVVDFFKEFYDPKGQIKKNKHAISDVEKMRGSVMRHLLITDHSLNRLDCQMENNEDFNQLDGFYNQTLEVLGKEKNLKIAQNSKKEEMDVDSLIRLEKLLETILKHNKKTKKTEIKETESKKYADFQQKSNKLLTLIDKTSRTIFREKHREFTTQVNKQMKAYQRRSMGNVSSLKKSSALGIYLTSIDPDEEHSLIKPSTIGTGHFKSSSISLPFTQKNDDRKILSFHDMPLSSERKHLSLNESKNHKSGIENFNKNANIYMPIVKKRALRTISNIIESTGTLQDVYQKERKNLGEMENECNKFFKETKNKINPPLESIIMTLEKPNPHFRFTGFKKAFAKVRKHYI